VLIKSPTHRPSICVKVYGQQISWIAWNYCQFIMASTNAYRIGRPVRRTPTCDMCKTRHQKCNGAQPRCNNCELRAINCSYSNLQSQVGGRTIGSPESSHSTSSVSGAFLFREGFTNPLHRNEPRFQPSLSDAEYERLHSQIFADIVSFGNGHPALK
jgi:hypothetical protein